MVAEVDLGPSVGTQNNWSGDIPESVSCLSIDLLLQTGPPLLESAGKDVSNPTVTSWVEWWDVEVAWRGCNT